MTGPQAFSKEINNSHNPSHSSPGDFDTKWQMDEALGAVHFRLACHDLDTPAPLSLEMKVQLPESRLEHLRKSMMWYKEALTDMASAPRGTEQVRDRVLEKYSHVQTFRKNASVVIVLINFKAD